MELRQAEALARTLMAQHGVNIPFKWSPSRTTFGAVKFRRLAGVAYPVHLQLSRPLVQATTDAQVRDTILHEIAHVLEGYESAHGPAWKARARMIGAVPKSCARDDEATKATAKYVVVCKVGGETLGTANSTRYNTERRYCPEHTKPGARAGVTLARNISRKF